MSRNLFDGSEESDNDLQLNTNKDYAKSYNSFRKKELLKKYKDRGLDVSESDFSSDSESSDEDEIIDAKFDKEFFETLASLKGKDPKIYDKNTRFFDLDGENDDDNKTTIKKKKSKPVTLKDYERKIIVEKQGKYEDDFDSEVEEIQQHRPYSPTLAEEERQLKAEFNKVVNADDSGEEEEEFGGIFKKRQKTKQEQVEEEEDFTKWLIGEEQDIKEHNREKLIPLKTYWSNTKLPQSERFLRDYILNKGYANVNTADIPTYDEIVGDNNISDDEEELEKQAEFEHKYNFRFEEPDSEFIQRYPRTIQNSVRQTDDKRKRKREEVKVRKQQEKDNKMRELEMVKEMKRKEIEEKINKIKLVTGNEELGFKDEELENEFDPEEHDRRMQEIFNDDYYQVDEGEEKPECPSDIDELKIEDWDNYDPNDISDNGDYYEPHCDDEDFNMDCEYDPAAAREQLQKELIESTKSSKKGRKGRRNRFKEMIQTDKPPFNPEDEKTYAEYIDEYYKIDCEDIIGDVPCRFKYVETTPNDFGLTIEEILLAKNKELNQWVSLKKAIQIRPENVEKRDQRLYKLKAKNDELKRKIFKSLYGEESDAEDESNFLSNNSNTEQLPTIQNDSKTPYSENSNQNDKKAKKKKKRKGQKLSEKEDCTIPLKKSKVEDAEEKTIIVSTSPTTETNKKQNQMKKMKSPKQNHTKQNIKEINKQMDHLNKNAKASEKNPFTKSGYSKQNDSISLHGSNKNQGKFKTKIDKFSNKKKFNTRNCANDNSSAISDERLKAYGINPRKFHKKQKYGNSEN